MAPPSPVAAAPRALRAELAARPRSADLAFHVAIDEIARGLAHAATLPAVRAQLAADLHASQAAEHKLYLQAYLADPAHAAVREAVVGYMTTHMPNSAAGALLALPTCDPPPELMMGAGGSGSASDGEALPQCGGGGGGGGGGGWTPPPGDCPIEPMAAVLGRDGAQSLCSGGGLPPLEMYMPIEEHEQQYTGGPDVMFVAVPHDEAYHLVGHYPDGRTQAVGIDDEPATPTFVITPVERAPNDGHFVSASFIPDQPGGDPPPPDDPPPPPDFGCGTQIVCENPMGGRGTLSDYLASASSTGCQLPDFGSGFNTYGRTRPTLEFVQCMYYNNGREARLLGKPEFKLYLRGQYRYPVGGCASFVCDVVPYWDDAVGVPEAGWSRRRTSNNTWRRWSPPFVLVNYRAVAVGGRKPYNPAWGDITVNCMEEDYNPWWLSPNAEVEANSPKFKVQVTDDVTAVGYIKFKLKFKPKNDKCGTAEIDVTKPIPSSPATAMSTKSPNDLVWYGGGFR